MEKACGCGGCYQAYNVVKKEDGDDVCIIC
jgi:hypothetical protein